MVELQIINKVLKDKDTSLLDMNDITRDYFNQYQEEYDYIMEHKQKYGNVPDLETFIAKFQDFDVVNVSESTEYLVNTFREEYLYSQSVPVLTKMAELLQTDAYSAVDYLKKELPNLKISGVSKGVDIIANAQERLEEWQNTKNSSDTHFIPTGFQEIDEDLGGWHKGEELVVLFARTGQGKSWVLIKMLEHAWKMNLTPGLLEPEMSANKTGYRFDTLHQHISSTALYRGEDIRGYEKYIDKLSASKIPFYVAHPKDFNRKVTVSKLKSWVEANHINILAVDGISYLQDERKERGDNTTAQLTHISEDLMQLSIDLEIPVLVVVQSNREGQMNEDLDLTNIRDSDGIAYNASVVLSIQQKETGLQIQNIKARNSRVGIKWVYMWDTDKGTFDYIPNPEKGKEDEEKSEDLRRRYHDKESEEY